MKQTANRASSERRDRIPESAGALMDVYMRNRVTLRAFLLNRTRSAGDADDLLQDLYLRIAGRDVEPAYRNPVAYLFSMAANLSVDLMRRQARERAWQDSETQQRLHLPEHLPSGEEALREREMLDRIAAVVKTMPSRQQCVFRMHRFEHMTHRQISDALGISVKMVEKHMTKALARCRRKLPEVWASPGQDC